ncbi:MAG: hypothetical protein RIE08_16455 [Acidimicrobiales bacterium]
MRLRLPSGLVVAGLIAVAAFGVFAAVDADARPSVDDAVVDPGTDDAPTLVAVLLLATLIAAVATPGGTVVNAPAPAPERVRRSRARDRSPPLR